MEENSHWQVAPESLSLENGEVHVWRICLQQPEEVVERFKRTLDSGELDRAGRFRFENHQRHFVVGRGFLREVLGRYLKAPPHEFRFSANDYGKPALIGEPRLQFNMSHSHEIALLAVTNDAELGVDVEYIRADFATEQIAERYFSRREVEKFSLLPKEEKVTAFFRCWTRKEAYIKAIGKGLSQPLDTFDVTLAPNEPAALLRADEKDERSWTLSDIDVGQGYAATLAVETGIERVRCWEYVGQNLQD